MNDAMNTAIFTVMLAMPVVLVGGFYLAYAQEEQRPYLDVPNTYRDQLATHITATVWDPKRSSLESAKPGLESQDIRFGGSWFAFENKTTDRLERHSTLYIALVSLTEGQKSLILQIMGIPEGGEFLFEPPERFLSLPDAPPEPSSIRLRVVFVDVVYTEQELVDFAETLMEELSAAGHDVSVVGPDITRNAIFIGFEKLDPEDIEAAKRIMIQRFGKEIPAIYEELARPIAEPLPPPEVVEEPASEGLMPISLVLGVIGVAVVGGLILLFVRRRR